MSAAHKENSIQLQARDIAVLRGLFESRVLSLAHTAALYFEGKADAAKKRIGKLKRAGYIGERNRRVYEPSVLFLTRTAFDYLSQHGHLLDYPQFSWGQLERRLQVSPITLRHELSVADCKAAFCAAVRTHEDLTVAEFATWPLLFQFNHAFHPATGERVTVKPDAFIRVRQDHVGDNPSEHTFYLEVDRSTEVQDVLVTRLLCYLDYYKRGGLAMKCGRRASEFRDFPFRVLVVCKSAERRNNLTEQLLRCNPPIRTFAMLTTLAEFIADPLSAIWVQPKDYLEATKGTSFDPMAQRHNGAYRRQVEREAMVERAIRKCMLMEN